jgi:hypothetical protein
VKIKLCKPFLKKYNVAAPSSITITIPGPEAADADRRRFLKLSPFSPIHRFYFILDKKP